MKRELLLEKIIEADGNEFELITENESLNEIVETLLKMQDNKMIRLGQFIVDGNSINLRADFLSDIPEPPPSIGQMIIERARKIVSVSFDEMQEEIDRLNKKIADLQKQLAER